MKYQGVKLYSTLVSTRLMNGNVRQHFAEVRAKAEARVAEELEKLRKSQPTDHAPAKWKSKRFRFKQTEPQPVVANPAEQAKRRRKVQSQQRDASSLESLTKSYDYSVYLNDETTDDMPLMRRAHASQSGETA